MNYDRILKWGKDGMDCDTCIGDSGCDTWIDECRKDGDCCDGTDRYYANAAQLEGLIKEAESGGHKWVRDNTPFICEHKTLCNDDYCMADKILGFYNDNAGKAFCPSNQGTSSARYVPYRGLKSKEEKTWPGKTGATHLEALKEIMGVKVKWFGAKIDKEENGGSIIIPTVEDCSEVETTTKWNDDGLKCGSCYFGGDLYACLSCGHAYKNYKRKQDRSDTNYTHNKEALKKAREDALKKESEGVDVEYVVLKNISLNSLSNKTNINAGVFLDIYRAKPYIDVCEGSLLNPYGLMYEHRYELLRLGFIEEKVCDPVVKKGDTFSIGHDIVRVCLVSNTHYQLISAIDGNRFTDIIVEPKDGKMKLSEFLEIPFTLGKFTPCKVKVEIIEG